MLGRHKCKIEKIKEQQVYNTKEVQLLYEQVFSASNEMNFLSHLHIEDRKIVAHQDTFSIKLQKNHFHLFLIPITIQGKQYQFIIDTGAQISGLLDKHQDLINQFQTKTKIPIKSANGTIKEVQNVCVDQFFLGALEIHHQSFVLLNQNDFKLPLIKKEMMAFDGIIGWDILSQFDFEIDTKKERFSLVKSNQMFTYCNLVHALFPVVVVYDDHKKPALFGLDTGAKVSWLDNNYCKQHHLKVARQSSGLQVGVLGIEKCKVQIIKECAFSLYQTRFTLEQTRTGDTQVFTNLKLDGIFGNEIFKGKKLQVLNSKGMLIIK